MAKVLISYFSEYGNHTYFALRDSLIENGNDVYLINWNNIIVKTKYWEDSIIPEEFKYLIDEIKNFPPDIVLNFCFILPIEILKKIKCPICIIDADNPSAFWNKNYFKIFAGKQNCFFLGGQSSSKKILEKFLNFKIDENHYIFAPVATGLKKQELPYKRNILFLGSIWLWYAEIPSKEKYEYIEYLHDIYLKDFTSDRNEIIKNYNKQRNATSYTPVSTDEVDFFFWSFAGQERMKYLDVLSDLGLEIYGNIWKQSACCHNINISKIAHDGLVSTAEEVSELYNSSKITVNFSNPQADTGFSWRVCDIMASNSCLLVEDKPDFRERFGKYLSEETLNTVIYKDRFDMRQKAMLLLNDEALRKRCVADLNNAIEQNGRWVHFLKKAEEVTGINLISSDLKSGKYIEIIKEQAPVFQQKANRKENYFVSTARYFFHIYEKFSTKIKQSNFANFILLLIILLFVFQEINTKFLSSPIISNEVLIYLDMGIICFGLISLLLSYLYKPIRFILKMTKKLLKIIFKR